MGGALFGHGGGVVASAEDSDSGGSRDHTSTQRHRLDVVGGEVVGGSADFALTDETAGAFADLSPCVRS